MKAIVSKKCIVSQADWIVHAGARRHVREADTGSRQEVISIPNQESGTPIGIPLSDQSHD